MEMTVLDIDPVFAIDTIAIKKGRRVIPPPFFLASGPKARRLRVFPV
jgi:hypothetical protein